MSRSAMSKPRGAGDRYSDYFMCGLRSFALHKWMDAINLQTQGSTDLLPTFRSLAMSDSLRQSERLYENWRKLFAKKHSTPLFSFSPAPTSIAPPHYLSLCLRIAEAPPSRGARVCVWHWRWENFESYSKFTKLSIKNPHVEVSVYSGPYDALLSHFCCELNPIEIIFTHPLHGDF